MQILPIDYPDIDLPFEQQHPLILLTQCIWGEARGEDTITKLMVGCVVRNRVDDPKWWGADWKSVILKPYQFSSFNTDDPNRKKMMVPLAFGDPGTWYECYYAAIGVYEGTVKDPTHGANSYYDISIPEPTWAHGKDPTIEWGRMRFYRL